MDIKEDKRCEKKGGENMKKKLTIKEGIIDRFIGEVEYLEIEFYETSTELTFKMGGIGYSLDVPSTYKIIIE